MRKSGVLEYKSANISETRRDRGKVTIIWRAYSNSPTLFRTAPSPTLYSFLLTIATQPKTPIAIISGTDEAIYFKFGRNIHSVHPNKSPLKILVKRERGHMQRLSNFFGTSNGWVNEGMGDPTNIKFVWKHSRGPSE